MEQITNFFQTTKGKLTALGVLLFLVVLSIIPRLGENGALLTKQPANKQAKTPSRGQTQKPAPQTNTSTTVVVRVGDETIYEKDIAIEAQAYPVKSAEAAALLTQKVITDSVILQAGAKEGLVSLDPSVFNSTSLDYAKRIALVDSVKNAIKAKTQGIQGTVVNLWFVNQKVGPLGYEESRRIAYEVVTSLHDRVVRGEITMDQAAEEIRNNASLAELDSQYQTNASFPFRVNPGEKISWDQAFDDALWQAPEGGVTDVFLGKSQDSEQNGQLVDAYFMFGQVTKRIDQGPESFETWLTTQEKVYGIP